MANWIADFRYAFRARKSMSRSRAFLAAASLLLAAPVLVHAQDTVVSGTVADVTDAVLPGVTVTARHVESGNTFFNVTDVSGQYRIGGLRPGVYDITAELGGFSVVTLEAVALQLGQQAAIDIEMSLSSVQETVTITGATPLLDVLTSDLGGNINSMQLSEIPVNGRNWMALTMLAPGSRANAVSNTPFGVSAGWFQLNMDGHQVSTSLTLGGIGQPRFSRDAIAEFELISSRFDATQGRSKGIQVNAVTKSGSNIFSGTLAGYFRDDKLNAEDTILGFTPAFQNQQVSVTFGGPIQQDKLHFFGYYEGERSPRTLSWNTPFPFFNIPDILNVDTVQQAGIRIDAQISDRTRLMVRGTGSVEKQRTGGGATSHPSVQQDVQRVSSQLFINLSQTFGSSSINEVKGGLAAFHYDSVGLPGLEDVPFVILPGLIAGKVFVFPLREYQDTYSIRNDFTTLRGNHTFKIGGEMLIPDNFLYWPNFRDSMILAFLGLPDDLQSVFPVWNDWSTWDLDALSPYTFQVRQGIGNFEYNRLKPEYGAWFQDDWRLDNLTLNLGIRWDFSTDAYTKEVSLPPFKPGGVGQEWWNFGPRLGFAYTLNERTVLRGGWGMFFQGMTDHVSHVTYISGVQTVAPELYNDGRPDFASNPFGGGTPAFDEAKLLPRDYATSWISSDQMRTPFTNQSSLGFQRQVAESMTFSADYVWNNEQRVESFRNSNVSFDPSTGAPMPFSNRANRVYPEWGLAVLRFTDSRTNYHAMETSFEKRFSNNWQLSGTYTLSGTWNYFPLPINPGCEFPFNGVTRTCNTPLPVPVVKDFGGDYTLSAAGGQATVPDQRHRAVFNGVWQLPGGVQLSGLYFFASGERREVTYNGNLRDSGSIPEVPNRLRPDGSIVPRNSFVGKPLHRVDLRLLKRFRVGGVQLDAIAEVFNLFNHKNYGNWVTDEANASYGGPQPTNAVEYQARQGQFGFRIAY